MITKEQAIKIGDGLIRDEIHCEVVRNCERIVGRRGGVTDKIVRVRPSGRCKTWKTRPNEFRLPVKFGLYESGAITESNCESFHLANECPRLLNVVSYSRRDVDAARALQETIDKAAITLVDGTIVKPRV